MLRFSQQDFAEQFEREEAERQRRKAEADAHEAEFQQEIAKDAAVPTFARLKQLVQRDYRAQLDDDVDAIWPEHLSDFPHRNIILYPDGELVSTRVQPDFSIERDDCCGSQRRDVRGGFRAFMAFGRMARRQHARTHAQWNGAAKQPHRCAR